MSLSLGNSTPTGRSAGHCCLAAFHCCSVSRRQAAGVSVTMGPSSPLIVRHRSREGSMNFIFSGSVSGGAALCVGRGLERVDADALDGVDEALVGGALVAIGVDHRLDDVGHF